MNVQFGCGGNRLEYWQNHDAEVDITQRLPYEDETVDYILIEHCLEHVTGPEAFHFMQEAHRILEPGGALRICVPTLSKIDDRSHAADLITGHGHKIVFSFVVLVDMLFAAGFEREKVKPSTRKPCDGHWKVIGEKKDTLETLRIEATK